MRKSIIQAAVIVLVFCAVGGQVCAQDYFVSPKGNDGNPGTKERPFATLEAARDSVRQQKKNDFTKKQKVVIYLRDGVYERAETFELDQRDSGTKGRPIIYRAYPGEEITILGGRHIPVSAVKPVTDSTILKCIIDPLAHTKIVQVDLKAIGINDYGKLRPHGFRRPYVSAHMELFVDDDAMRLAQWPNPDEPRVPIGKVLDKGSIPRNGDFTNRGGKFHYDTDRPQHWKQADDVWFSGFFNNGYADDTVRVKHFDFKNKVIETVQPHMYGFKSGSAWNRWFALNLLEEIDQPGEYYCDSKNGILYFYPPKFFDVENSDIRVSILEEPMIVLEGASHVYFENITFECTRGMGVYIERGEGCRINGCTLRNMGMVAVCVGQGTEDLDNYAHEGTAAPASRRLGSWHEHIYKNTVFDRHAGKDHGIVSCDIYNIGAGAVHLGGGDRATLTPTGNFIRNCDIHDYNRLGRSYKAGVNIDGVGNRIEHCNIHSAPANAIYLHGNDHIVEFNEIHHVMLDGDDQGAWYMGRDPSEFGNMIRYNFFHNIGITSKTHATWGIYYDDMAGGTSAVGNVFYKVGRKAAFLVGGGKYNEIRNNIFVNCNMCVQMGNRGQSWAKGNLNKGGLFEDRTLEQVNITQTPYRNRYPQLANYWNDTPGRPANPIEQNLAVQCGRLTNAKAEWGPIENNWETKEDPGFVDMAYGDFALKTESAVYKHIDGFEAPPFSKMGLYRDRWRKTLPERVGFRKKIDLSKVKAATDVRVNFQTSEMSRPDGWVVDDGRLFEIRPEGYAYGWTKDNTGSARQRGKNADPLLDSLVHFVAGASWEIAVENGHYRVEVCLGDSEFHSSDADLSAEDSVFLDSAELKADEFRRVVKAVEVTDGKLTVTSNNNPHGSGLTRINYIQLKKISEKDAARIISEQPAKVELNPYSVKWYTLGRNSLDSMPIGNGDIGLNVWTEQNGDLVFYLSKTDAWSENCRLLKLGKVRVTLSPNPFASGVLFSQELSVKDGQIVIESGRKGNGTKLIIWVDANNPAVNIEMKSEMPVEAKVAFEPWRTKRRQLAGSETHSAYGLHGKGALPIFVEPDTIVAGQKDRIIWYHRNNRSIWKANLELQALGDMVAKLKDPLLNRTFGALIEGEGLVSDMETTLRSQKPQREWMISIYPLTAQTDSPEAWLSQVKRNAARIGSVSYDKRMKDHQNWWQQFWDRSYIHITSMDPKDRLITEKITRGYILQRWINACSGRGNSPIKFNGSIFNVDTMKYKDKFKGFDADFRQWGGPYWWQNTRLPYWSMLSSGDYDLMKPLFNLYSSALPIRRAATRKYYGHDGAFIPETMYFWGTYVDGNYGHDRKDMPDGLTENLFIRYYWQSGLELSLMMLDYYSHTQDKEFAEKTLLPFAQDIITFYDQHWDRDNSGKILFDPAMALETYRKATNPLVEIVGIAKVCNGLLLLPDFIVTAERSSQWNRLISELPEVPMEEIDGKKVLAPAHQYSEKQNVENPEMYAVFPYRVYGVGKDNIDIARNTFARRTHKNSGGWQQNAIQAAFLAIADEAAKLVAYNFTHQDSRYRFDAMWGPNYDWTPDQDHGSVAMTALQRMLLQYEGEKIYLLPAWPKKWDVEFKLHAPDKTVVEGIYKNGSLQQLNTTPNSRKNDIQLENK